MNWTALQLALVHTLDAYESAERASAICGDKIEGQWRKADELHNELLKVALRCDYEPGGRHRHLSTVQFCRQRAAALAALHFDPIRKAA